MKKTYLILFLILTLLLSAFPVSAKNVMSYFRTVHIIERDAEITPEAMFLMVKEAAKKQIENGEQFKVIKQNFNNISENKTPVSSLLEHLRSH